MNSRTKTSLLALIGTVFAIFSAHAQQELRLGLTNQQVGVFDLTVSSPSASFAFPVSGDTWILDIVTASVMLDVSVVDPNGAPVDPSQFDTFFLADPDVPPLGAALFPAGQHTVLQVDTPSQGVWNVTITLPAGVPEAVGNVVAYSVGGVAGSLFTSRPAYRSDDPVVLALALFDGETPVTGVTVAVDIFTEAGMQTPVVSALALRDDGIAPDEVIDDGLYTAQATGLPADQYLTQATVTGAGGELQFGTSFYVIAPAADILAPANDQGVDQNNDGLFDVIEVSVDADIVGAGDYGMIVTLQSASGNTLSAGAKSTVPAGVVDTFNIRFTAEAVREFLGEDGPYTYADVMLTRLGDLVAGERDQVADRRSDLGQTGAYFLTELQRPVTLILPGVSDTATDTDTDGDFDQLIVEFDIDVLLAGTYTWSGDLRSPTGQVVSVASAFGALAEGPNTVSLVFDGAEIGAAGLDGPYLVANVAAYGPPDAAAVVDELGVTQQYFASDFEGFDPGSCETVVGEANLKLSGKKLEWRLTNMGDETVRLESAELVWPSAVGALRKIELSGKIFDSELPPPNAVIDSWLGDPKKREIKAGKEKKFKIEFSDSVRDTDVVDYGLALALDLGCTVLFTPGMPEVEERDFRIKDRKIEWELENTGTVNASISLLTLGWPNELGAVRKIEFDGKLFDGPAAPPGLTLTGPELGDLSKRQLRPGEKRKLKIEFMNDASGTSRGDFTIDLEFAEGQGVSLNP